MGVSFVKFFSVVWLKMQEGDKRKHVVWSFWLMLSASFLTCRPEAFALVFLLGLAKECWDHFYGSGFCFYDIAGNFVGSGAALALSFLFWAPGCRAVGFFLEGSCCVY